MNKGILSVEAVNIRDYAFNKHQKVDDYPYGGGAGMLMQAEPVYLAYEAIAEKAGICVKRPGLFISLHRDRYLIRQWQQKWRKEEICFSLWTL